MKNPAEITQQNEEFLSKIIGEMTANDADIIPPAEETDTTTIPESDPTDPEIAVIRIKLCSGEEVGMGVTASVFEEWMQQLQNIEGMVEFLKGDVTSLFKNGYQKDLEDRVMTYIEDLDIPTEAYTTIKDDALRLMFELTDCISMYSTISHILNEKRLTDGIFSMLLGPNMSQEENNDENSKAEN